MIESVITHQRTWEDFCAYSEVGETQTHRGKQIFAHVTHSDVPLTDVETA